jgi:tRNA(fMet)-specific endonuclease VapC
MTYLLDTNSCIRYLSGRSEPLRRRIEQAGSDQLVVCSIVKAEMFFGAMKGTTADETFAEQKVFFERFNSIPFDDQAAEAYGMIRADLQRRGLPIGSNDYLIAAIALANDLTLVTHNTREFTRVPGLRVEDWESED